MTNQLLKMGFPPEQIDIFSEYGIQLSRAGYDATEIYSYLLIRTYSSTSNPKKNQGSVRDGVVVQYKGKKFVNVGFEQLIPFYSKDDDGKRIIMREIQGRLSSFNK